MKSAGVPTSAFMGAAKIAGIADHERVTQAPPLTESIRCMIDGRDNLPIRPIGNDTHTVIRNTQSRDPLGHALPQHYVHVGCLQRTVAKPSHQAIGD